MGLNKVILQGNMVETPTLQQTPSGVDVTTFRIAVGRRFAKSDSEVKADFFTCVAWRGLAEFVAKYFQKGKSIVVVGNLQNRSFTTQDGQKRTVTEVVAEECHFCGNKEQGANDGTPMIDTGTPMTDGFMEVPNDEDLPF